jgi:hypothetical protein
VGLLASDASAASVAASDVSPASEAPSAASPASEAASEASPASPPVELLLELLLELVLPPLPECDELEVVRLLDALLLFEPDSVLDELLDSPALPPEPPLLQPSPATPTAREVIPRMTKPHWLVLMVTSF